VRAKQRWIWLKSIRLLKHHHHLLLLLHHHLAGVCPCKKIQRLKRLSRSSAIRVVMMEKLWYLRFCVSPALLVLSSVVCNQIVDYFIVLVMQNQDWLTSQAPCNNSVIQMENLSRSSENDGMVTRLSYSVSLLSARNLPRRCTEEVEGSLSGARLYDKNYHQTKEVFVSFQMRAWITSSMWRRRS